MKITKSEFSVSSATVSQCPKDTKPEYAFIGRSNVGKSSLINMLCNHKGLAKTSATPGKTLLINHFIINNEWYLVDLPGYGYARTSRSSREQWSKMMRDYFLHREQLTNTYVLVDSRIPPQRIDLEFIEWLGENGIPFSIVFTKADKLSKGKLAANIKHYLGELSKQWEELPPYFITSSETKQGREELLDYIDEILGN